jgi:hypothetical protein
LAGTLLQLLAGVETAMRGPGALQMPPLGDIR